ncbi:MAG: amidohydrolase family protein [Myxococcales bacterium]|nr:amidohydrolase family protein [Myxococcales bacterium]
MSEILIRGATLYDGRGGVGRREDVLVRDGRVARIGRALRPERDDAEIIDATGLWLAPGFVDLHTHYDAEVEVGPALFESLRHGVTTIALGSCSLSMVLGDAVDLADMFCRVEAIPREIVLPLVQQKKTWDSPREYLEHLDALALGPNVTCMLGHSTIRAAAMGMQRALTKGERPTPAEMAQMTAWLDEALDAGYVGLSISTLPWDKMDGDEFRSRPMPSVFASWREYRALARTLRRRGRVLQAVPNISTKINILLFYLMSAGRFRRPLKTTLISMMDVRADRYAFRIGGALARLFNRLLGADFKMQALPEVFDLWADGIDLVVFEEFEAGAAALHLQHAAERDALLSDPAYRARFKKQWRSRFMPRAFHRNLRHAEIVACPDAALVGKTFDALGRAAGRDAVDVFLDLVVEHGRALRWYTVMGNDRPEWLRFIVSHPDILIGFSDAGAHLRNMAHYNFPLRLLRMVRDAEREGCAFMTVGRAVQRLTSEIADWLGIDAGVVAEGRRADLVLVRPEALDARLEAIHEQSVAEYRGLRRLVRRNDEAVEAVIVGGRVAARRGVPSDDLGQRPYGQVLRAAAA